jgi:hypothetical protein
VPEYHFAALAHDRSWHSADEPGCPHSRRVLEGKRTIRKPTSQEEASRCGSAVDLPSGCRGRNYLLVNRAPTTLLAQIKDR